MATDRFNIGTKFETGDIPSQSDFKEIFDSFVHKDEDKADFQMVEAGISNEHYVTPALLYNGLKNIGIITGNCYMPHKEYFESTFSGTSLSLEKLPIQYSVKLYKNGQLLQEGEDYAVDYNTAVITFSAPVSDRNLEVNYWYKNLGPNPGGEAGEPIDFTSFLHTSGNETKNGLLTFNNTTAASTSGIVLTNSATGTTSASLDVNVSGTGSGVSVQNSAAGKGVKLSNTGAGVGAYLNSTSASVGDVLQVAKDDVVKTKIDANGIVTAPKYVTSGGTASEFVKGDGSLDNTVYAEDTEVLHTTGNESKDGALTLTHDSSPQDVLTISKNNSANCLKLVQNSNSNATTSTWDTSTANVNRKAISIKKQENEKAFITHDGNVTATSFTTLSSKADITDGLLSLASSASPTASQDHAKLYAKNDGTNTDMYVMGSDGVEKKIGGGGGDLDNVLHKTGFSTETKTGELVIDSGAADVSGLVLKKITQEAAVINGGILYSTGYNNPYNMVELSTKEVLVANNGGNNVLKIPANGGTPSTYSSGIASASGIALLPNGETLVGSIGTNSIYKIPVDGGDPVLYSAGVNSPNCIAVFPNGEALVGSANNGLYKIPIGGGTPILYSSASQTVRDVVILPNGDSLIACQSSTVYKIPLGGGSGTVYATVPANSISLCLLTNGEVLVGAPYSSQVHKIPVGGGASSVYALISNFYAYMALKADGTILISGLNNDDIRTLNTLSSKVLKTDTSGLVVKTQYLEDVPYLKASDVDLSSYAKLASPGLTGIPTAPTAVVGTNTKQIATTEFVIANTFPKVPHLEFDNTTKTIWNNGQGDNISNTAFGENILKSNTTGYGNTAFGYNNLADNTTGLANTAIGSWALRNNIVGNENTAIGLNALFNCKGNNNTAIGKAAGAYLSTGENNIFIGREVGSGITTGSGNLIIGAFNTQLATLTNNIIIANGAGTMAAQHDGINWTFKGQINKYSLDIAPETSTSTGKSGEIRITADYIYVCKQPNVWVRTALNA